MRCRFFCEQIYENSLFAFRVGSIFAIEKEKTVRHGSLCHAFHTFRICKLVIYTISYEFYTKHCYATQSDAFLLMAMISKRWITSIISLIGRVGDHGTGKDIWGLDFVW